VRRASANVVSVIAKYAVPGGEWPDLLPFLFQCSHSPQEEHREVSVHKLSCIEEHRLLAISISCIYSAISNLHITKLGQSQHDT
jgi:hypothetical protein